MSEKNNVCFYRKKSVRASYRAEWIVDTQSMFRKMFRMYLLAVAYYTLALYTTYFTLHNMHCTMYTTHC